MPKPKSVIEAYGLLSDSVHFCRCTTLSGKPECRQPDKLTSFPNAPDQEYRDKPVPPVQPSLPPQQYHSASVPPGGFAGSAAIPLSAQPASQLPTSTGAGEKLPPYPLYPLGLIPGMVRKMQIGSGVPYCPMSSYLLQMSRRLKFLKEYQSALEKLERLTPQDP